MYKVSIYNNVETIIHYPTSDSEAPHLNKLNKKEKDSQADSLTFTILKNNSGYDLLSELTTKVQVTDTRDNTIEFDGRVLSITEKMDSSGLFYKEVISEGSLNYLVDTKTRKHIYEVKTPAYILSDLLTAHNSKVSLDKQIQVGNIEITNATTIQISFQSILSVLQAIKENLGGHFKVRLENGVRYLDYINAINTDISIQLGENMKEMLVENDVTEIGTRIIPVGKNELTIESVNGGLDYVDDATAIATYGVIEKVVEYKDIEDAATLYNQTLDDLDKYTQSKQVLECSALDLSVLSNVSTNKFTINKSIHISNPVMGINADYEIVEADRDLLQDYNPKFTISNAPARLTDKIIEFNNTKSLVDKVTTTDGQMNTYWLDGVINAMKNQLVASGAYSNVQVVNDKGLLFENTDAESEDYGALYLGPGIFAIANSKTAEGNWNWRSFGTGKGFTADEIVAGVLKGIKIQEINDLGNVLAELYKNSNGGLMQIFDNDGNLNVKIGSENGTGGNNGGMFILYNDGSDKPRVEFGISLDRDSGIINLKDSNGVVRATLNADINGSPKFHLLNADGSSRLFQVDSAICAYKANTIIHTGNIDTYVNQPEPYQSGDFSSPGGRIYPSDSLPNFYIQHDTDGSCSIHWDSSSYVKINADGCTWY